MELQQVEIRLAPLRKLRKLHRLRRWLAKKLDPIPYEGPFGIIEFTYSDGFIHQINPGPFTAATNLVLPFGDEEVIPDSLTH